MDSKSHIDLTNAICSSHSQLTLEDYYGDVWWSYYLKFIAKTYQSYADYVSNYKLAKNQVVRDNSRIDNTPV